jgi:hypothetical protein
MERFGPLKRGRKTGSGGCLGLVSGAGHVGALRASRSAEGLNQARREVPDDGQGATVANLAPEGPGRASRRGCALGPHGVARRRPPVGLMRRTLYILMWQ